jgi:glutaconate CoA-transferase subunit B
VSNYNTMELMIAVAARELEDGASVGVGTGAPCASAMLAQKTSAPKLLIIFEAGDISPQLPEMPISVGDSRAFYNAAMAGSMGDTMEACSRGLADYTFGGDFTPSRIYF